MHIGPGVQPACAPLFGSPESANDVIAVASQSRNQIGRNWIAAGERCHFGTSAEPLEPLVVQRKVKLAGYDPSWSDRYPFWSLGGR